MALNEAQRFFLLALQSVNLGARGGKSSTHGFEGWNQGTCHRMMETPVLLQNGRITRRTQKGFPIHGESTYH